MSVFIMQTLPNTVRLIYSAVQVEGVQGAAGRPDGIDLGVGRGIVVEGDAVGPGGNDLSILHDDGPEGTAPV